MCGLNNLSDMTNIRLIILIGFLSFSICVFGVSPIQETQTPTSYTMKWNETGKNGGTVRGIFSGPMKDGKRNGRWTVDIKFNLFGDDDFRTGTITMVRNYTNGIPDGPYSYHFDVNWRDGAYNPYQGKWIYGAPSGNKESVTGAFKMGRPDGVWTIKSDKRLGSDATITFNNGLPVGKYIRKNSIEIFDKNGLLIEDIQNNGDGWKYKVDSELLLENNKNDGIRLFFYLLGEDDEDYFAHAGELYTWLLAYPYGASDERTIYDYTVLNNDDLDLDFIEFVGSEEYINTQIDLHTRNKESKLLGEICKELQKINDIYTWKIEEYERNPPKSKRNEFVALYMTKRSRELLDSLSPTLNRIEDIQLVKDIMEGKKGKDDIYIREYINNFRALNQQNSLATIEALEANVSRLLKNGRKVCEVLNIDPSIITNEEIEKYYDGQTGALANMSFHLAHDNCNTYKDKLERLIREKRYSLKRANELDNEDWIKTLKDELTTIEDDYDDVVAMNGYYVEIENPNEWIRYVNRKGVNEIAVPADITFRDFV